MFVCLDSSPLIFSLATHFDKLVLLNGIYLSVMSGKALRYLTGQIIQIISPLSIPIWHKFDSSFFFCGYFFLFLLKKAVCTIHFPFFQPLLSGLELTSLLSAFKKLVFIIPQTFGFCVKLQELK